LPPPFPPALPPLLCSAGALVAGGTRAFAKAAPGRVAGGRVVAVAIDSGGPGAGNNIRACVVIGAGAAGAGVVVVIVVVNSTYSCML